MPGYGSNARAGMLRNNQQVFLWNQEIVAASTLSIAVELERINRSFYPWGLSFEVVFGGDPGVFEIDLMGANINNKANFLSLGNITTAAGSTVAGNYVGRWDMATNMWPKFVAGYIKTLTNAVTVTLQVTK